MIEFTMTVIKTGVEHYRAVAVTHKTTQWVVGTGPTMIMAINNCLGELAQYHADQIPFNDSLPEKKYLCGREEVCDMPECEHNRCGK